MLPWLQRNPAGGGIWAHDSCARPKGLAKAGDVGKAQCCNTLSLGALSPASPNMAGPASPAGFCYFWAVAPEPLKLGTQRKLAGRPAATRNPRRRRSWCPTIQRRPPQQHIALAGAAVRAAVGTDVRGPGRDRDTLRLPVVPCVPAGFARQPDRGEGGALLAHCAGPRRTPTR